MFLFESCVRDLLTDAPSWFLGCKVSGNRDVINIRACVKEEFREI